MAIFNVRIDDALARDFDRWAAPRGGRSAALRSLIRGVSSFSAGEEESSGRRPVRMTVRLSAADGAGLAAASAALGLTPSAWAAALIRRRLGGRPTWPRPAELALLGAQGELRRVGVNINQIARALNTAVIEGRVLALELELEQLDAFRLEIRAELAALAEAMRSGLAYWEVDL